MVSLRYINAEDTDGEMLTHAAIASKKHWGYTDDLIELWRSDLTVTAGYIRANKVVKVFHRDELIGFFGIVTLDDHVAEIDHLWILPGHTGMGYGRQIFGY